MKAQIGDIIIQTTEYTVEKTNKTYKYLDVRKYFIPDSDSNEPKPTQKGVTFNKEKFIELMKILKENEKEILEFLK